MRERATVAFYWSRACSDCESSLFSLAHEVASDFAGIDVAFWPVALDFRYRRLKGMADGSLLASFVSGYVGSRQQARMVGLLREKSRVVVAYGSCSCLNSLPGMTGEIGLEAGDSSNGAGACSIDRLIDVDYYLPGCPPPSSLLRQASEILLSGQWPQKGSVLAPDNPLCSECPRRVTRPFASPDERALANPDEITELCYLEMGVACLGPASRAGCQARCISTHKPCTGCSGPTSVSDPAEDVLRALTSGVELDSPDLEEILAGVPDPFRAFYRYRLSRTLRGK
jgi:F420-non-reducing hydrogenase small subunit